MMSPRMPASRPHRHSSAGRTLGSPDGAGGPGRRGGCRSGAGRWAGACSRAPGSPAGAADGRAAGGGAVREGAPGRGAAGWLRRGRLVPVSEGDSLPAPARCPGGDGEDVGFRDGSGWTVTHPASATSNRMITTVRRIGSMPCPTPHRHRRSPAARRVPPRTTRRAPAAKPLRTVPSSAEAVSRMARAGPPASPDVAPPPLREFFRRPSHVPLEPSRTSSPPRREVLGTFPGLRNRRRFPAPTRACSARWPPIACAGRHPNRWRGAWRWT